MSEFADMPTGSDQPQRESLDWIVRLTSGRATAVDAEGLAAWKARSSAHLAAFEEALRLRQSLRLAGREYLASQEAGAMAISLVASRDRNRIGRRAVLTGAG